MNFREIGASKTKLIHNFGKLAGRVKNNDMLYTGLFICSLHPAPEGQTFYFVPLSLPRRNIL